MLIGKLKTAPTIEPVTLAEAQTHLLINGQDEYINGLIKASREVVERYLNRALILQTWTAYADRWCGEMSLPMGTLLAVASLKYYNLGATLTTITTTDYWVDTVNEPGNVRFVYDWCPPEIQYGRSNAIEIEFTAGYLAGGTSLEKQAAVPSPIKHAMKILMTDMHEHRGQYVVGNTASKIPDLIKNLLHPYRLYNF